MTQTVGIVGIFVAGHDLINALPQQLQRIMAHPLVVSRIVDDCNLLQKRVEFPAGDRRVSTWTALRLETTIPFAPEGPESRGNGIVRVDTAQARRDNSMSEYRFGCWSSPQPPNWANNSYEGIFLSGS